MSEEKFILHYFKVNARGTIARALLSHAKANWEDHYINFDEWKEKYKPNKEFCEYGQLPILEYKGKYYAQSMAIELFLAKKFNLLGDNEDEDYEINNLLCSFEDFFPLIHDMNDQTKEKTYAKLRQYLKVYEEKYLKNVKANNGGKFFFAKGKFTLADAYFGSLIYTLLNRLNEINLEKEFPELKKLMDSYKGEDALKDFYEKFYIKDSRF